METCAYQKDQPEGHELDPTMETTPGNQQKLYRYEKESQMNHCTYSEMNFSKELLGNQQKLYRYEKDSQMKHCTYKDMNLSKETLACWWHPLV